MTAKEYLLDIGFDDAHLPELFNNDDKSYYQITELMEEYHERKLKLLGTGGVSNSYGFQIGEHIFEIEEDTERDAMLILVKDHWDWIDKLEKVELLGEIEK